MMYQRLLTTRDGTRINVRELGTGPTVLLIHGWSLSGEVWDRQLRVLAEAGYRVLAIDQRGHGGSDAPMSGYDIDSLAQDALDVISESGVGAATVVGWSLGGMVAIRAAHLAPEAVARVVTVASNGFAAARTDSFEFGVPADGPLAAILAAEHDDRVTLRRSAIGDPFKTPPAESVLDWLHRISLQTPSWAGRAAMRTLMCTDQTNLMSTVAVPVSMLIGTADPALSVRGARWVAQQLGSTIIEFDTGHYPMLEAADEFDSALLYAVAGSFDAGSSYDSAV